MNPHVRRNGAQFDFHVHHRWRLKPHFKVGDPLYYDHDNDVTLTSLPESLQGKILMQIQTVHVRRSPRARRVIRAIRCHRCTLKSALVESSSMSCLE